MTVYLLMWLMSWTLMPWGHEVLNQWKAVQTLAREDAQVLKLANSAMRLRQSIEIHNVLAQASCINPNPANESQASAVLIRLQWQAVLGQHLVLGTTQHSSLNEKVVCPNAGPLFQWGPDPWIRFKSWSGHSGYIATQNQWTYRK